MLGLIAQCAKAPEAGRVEGATNAQILALQDDLNLEIPSALEQWLRICNGYAVGPGGLLGAATTEPILNIALCQRDWGYWRDHSWIPIATDACGNPWVLDGGDPSDDSVYFVETSEPETLDYVTASSLERFLVNVLTDEIEPTGWPFDKEHMSWVDPALLSCLKAPMPWDA